MPKTLAEANNRLIVRFTLSDEYQKLLTVAVGDSGKTDVDWLWKQLLDEVKGVLKGYRLWQLGKRIEGKRPKKGTYEEEPFVMEADEFDVARFRPPKDPIPEGDHTLEFSNFSFLEERFGFWYSMQQLYERRMAMTVPRFLASNFQDALEERLQEIITVGVSKEDEKESGELADATNEDPKKKEGKPSKKE